MYHEPLDCAVSAALPSDGSLRNPVAHLEGRIAAAHRRCDDALTAPSRVAPHWRERLRDTVRRRHEDPTAAMQDPMAALYAGDADASAVSTEGEAEVEPEHCSSEDDDALNREATDAHRSALAAAAVSLVRNKTRRLPSRPENPSAGGLPPRSGLVSSQPPTPRGIQPGRGTSSAYPQRLPSPDAVIAGRGSSLGHSTGAPGAAPARRMLQDSSSQLQRAAEALSRSNDLLEESRRGQHLAEAEAKELRSRCELLERHLSDEKGRRVESDRRVLQLERVVKELQAGFEAKFTELSDTVKGHADTAQEQLRREQRRVRELEAELRAAAKIAALASDVRFGRDDPSAASMPRAASSAPRAAREDHSGDRPVRPLLAAEPGSAATYLEAMQHLGNVEGELRFEQQRTAALEEELLAARSAANAARLAQEPVPQARRPLGTREQPMPQTQTRPQPQGQSQTRAAARPHPSLPQAYPEGLVPPSRQFPREPTTSDEEAAPQGDAAAPHHRLLAEIHRMTAGTMRHVVQRDTHRHHDDGSASLTPHGDSSYVSSYHEFQPARHPPRYSTGLSTSSDDAAAPEGARHRDSISDTTCPPAPAARAAPEFRHARVVDTPGQVAGAGAREPAVEPPSSSGWSASGYEDEPRSPPRPSTGTVPPPPRLPPRSATPASPAPAKQAPGPTVGAQLAPRASGAELRTQSPPADRPAPPAGHQDVIRRAAARPKAVALREPRDPRGPSVQERLDHGAVPAAVTAMPAAPIGRPSRDKSGSGGPVGTAKASGRSPTAAGVLNHSAGSDQTADTLTKLYRNHRSVSAEP